MKHTLRNNTQDMLSYAEYGEPDGFPILIQHGLIASIGDAALFEGLIGLGARLICIARPGYGASSPVLMERIGDYAEIVSVLVEKLGLSQFDVLGISSGAPYSYVLGYRFPERARNLFIFSGIPALYDETIQAQWPWPVQTDASMDEMQRLAWELFFAHLSARELESADIQDSLMNRCFGVAQDLRIRGKDWGFRLSQVQQPVFMRHSRADSAVPCLSAEMTAKLLPDCRLETREDDVHFSPESLDDFIQSVMAGWYEAGDSCR